MPTGGTVVDIAASTFSPEVQAAFSWRTGDSAMHVRGDEKPVGAGIYFKHMS
jgi:hypothetical protein